MEKEEREADGHYQCFCLKIYRSFSGIYLHLRYKHQEFFQKYSPQMLASLFEPAAEQPSRRKTLYRITPPV